MNLLIIFCLVHQKFDSFKESLVGIPYGPGIEGPRNVDRTNWFHKRHCHRVVERFRRRKIQNYSVVVYVEMYNSLCENNMYVIYKTSDTTLLYVISIAFCLELFEKFQVFVRVCSSLFKCSFCVLAYVSFCYFTYLMHWIELFFLLLLDCFSSLNLLFWLNLNFWLVWISKSLINLTVTHLTLSRIEYPEPWSKADRVVFNSQKTLNNIQHKNLKIHFQACQIFRLAIIINYLILTF